MSQCQTSMDATINMWYPGNRCHALSASVVNEISNIFSFFQTYQKHKDKIEPEAQQQTAEIHVNNCPFCFSVPIAIEGCNQTTGYAGYTRQNYVGQLVQSLATYASSAQCNNHKSTSRI